MLVNLQSRHVDPWIDLHWQPDTQALLGEHHLAASSPSVAAQARFVSSLYRFLSAQSHTEAWLLQCGGRFDLPSIAGQLTLFSDAPRIAPKIHGAGGIVAAVRQLVSDPGASLSRARFIICHGVDNALENDTPLFAQLADALMGVAAELEFASETLLTVQRVIFVGGDRLHAYARDAAGALKRWLPDAAGTTPFWKLVSGVPTPPLKTYTIERLMSGGVYDELDLALD